MARALTATRLPGIRFETVPPARQDFLPRMDIAMFVGFATCGPLNVPVPVEDAAQFEAVFGGDLPLVWDFERGEQVYAWLAPAVRAYFNNGGRRCWVVRVADDRQAHTAWFQIPGVVQTNGSGFTPAFAHARSAGFWGDSLRVSDALTVTPVNFGEFNPDQATLNLSLVKPGLVVAGDVLRLSFGDLDYCVLGVVTTLKSRENGIDSALARELSVGLGNLAWLRPAYKQTPASLETKIKAYTHREALPALEAKVPEIEKGSGVADFPHDDGNLVCLDCLEALTDEWWAASDPGNMLKVTFSNGELWLLITDQTAGDDEDSAPGGVTRFSGQAVWQVEKPDSLPILRTVEKLTFELWVKEGDKNTRRLTGLGFARPQPFYWGALPTDEMLYTTHAHAATGDESYTDGLANQQFADSKDLFADGPYPALWRAAASPRFPLAGTGDGISLPFVMGVLTAPFTGPDEPEGDALIRNGLEKFSAAMFLDPDLAGLGGEALMLTADDIRYLSSSPRGLRGIHAALSVDEATIVAAPDAAHYGWHLPDAVAPPAPPVFERSLLRSEWLHADSCPIPDDIDPKSEPDWGKFLRCGIRVIESPELSASTPDSSNSFRLTWTEIKLEVVGKDVEATYYLEEATLPDFSDNKLLYSGKENRYDIFGYAYGIYYYRVRAEFVTSDDFVETSDWSEGVVVRLSPSSGWQMTLRADYEPGNLLAVQRCLLRIGAARGDLFAVLSVPGHLREQDAIHYSLDLQSPLADPIAITVPDLDTSLGTMIADVPSLGYSEARALTFGALYHPWTYISESSSAQTRLCPPDGVAMGVLARRAFERGAWVAPANDAMRGVVALSPQLSKERWLDMQDANLNILRREPGGFMCLSEYTLSDDPDWTLVNVRRLINLLRRLAQKYGATYVFEPNGDQFARTVKMLFESFMNRMFVRGAFAGSTPETSYQVSVNMTQQDHDEGRFIVELRVAPSLPMRFITVRLVQSGEKSLVSEGG